jgi:sugar porter (SP) family MFS transporter
MFTAFGVLLGFVANVAVYNFQSPWRMQLAFPFVPALPLALLIMLCPESPAWLVKSSRDYRGAFRSLNRLRNIELQAAKELYAMHLQASNIIPSEQRAGFSLKLVELLKIPRIRRATLAAFVVMLSQQLCGINIISFYSSTIFSDAGFTTFHALLASTVFGFINFIGAFPAVWTMDRLGRRSLLLLTLPFMALTMLATSLTFSLPETSPARFGLLAATIYLFCAEYSPGMGPVPNPYAAEVFPLSHREIGMSFAVSVANVWASVLSLTFPSILTLLRPQGAFTLYACLNVLAFVLVFLFVPETRMKTLDELDDVFSVPTRVFVRQHTMACMPRWIRRHVLLLNEGQSKTPGHAGTYSAVNQDEGLE